LLDSLLQEKLMEAAVEDESENENVNDPVNSPPPVPPLDGSSVIIVETDAANVLQEIASNIGDLAGSVVDLLSAFNKCLRLIESSAEENFTQWEKLNDSFDLILADPRLSDKMKMRCFLVNKNNVRTFNFLQGKFQLDLDHLYYMGKMNLLHICCDVGWAELAAELLTVHGMNPNLACPSLHMRPAHLTPLMLAAGAGHESLVGHLLSHRSIDTELKDSYGMTALFHTCNHGAHRVGDQHGFFRRLWSWDLSHQQLQDMESIGRRGALPIIKLLLRHGADLSQRDKTGATLLTRASSVDMFTGVITFLVEVGCRPTENILNWTKVRNPSLVVRLEREMKSPGSLMRQARLVIWRVLREAQGQGEGEGFRDRIEQLGRRECLPAVLSDYMLCLH